jgi:chemotaxis signal transduction protein
VTAAGYVLFPLGEKRFALRADLVAELARPGRLYAFPHTTPLLTGVLLRRGRIVPVCDVGQLLVGHDAPARRFYVVVRCHPRGEWTAIPVTGECELVNGEESKPVGGLPPWVTSLLSVTGAGKGRRGETVELLDLEQLIPAGRAEVRA